VEETTPASVEVAPIETETETETEISTPVAVPIVDIAEMESLKTQIETLQAEVGVTSTRGLYFKF
jgi:hypothetical protein